MTIDADASATPKVFVSYSWDTAEHKRWVKDLAMRLRSDGVDVSLDQWNLVPGDQLPKFMETAIRENSYVVIVCTPAYKKKSDGRIGGVGYEGDIMTAEVLTQKNDRKFISVLRSGSWSASMPSWLKGKYSIDLSGNPYAEEQYGDLLVTLQNRREQAPPIGRPPRLGTAKPTRQEKPRPSLEFEPIRIEGVLADEVGRPRNDGSRGSALYEVPFKLSRVPSQDWIDHFLRTWDHPPRYSLRHRPRTAEVHGDRIVLTRTTIEEVRDVHRETLKLVVEAVNKAIADLTSRRRADEEARRREAQEHEDNVRRVAGEIGFD